jgi:hypothetical protein
VLHLRYPVCLVPGDAWGEGTWRQSRTRRWGTHFDIFGYSRAELDPPNEAFDLCTSVITHGGTTYRIEEEGEDGPQIWEYGFNSKTDDERDCDDEANTPGFADVFEHLEGEIYCGEIYCGEIRKIAVIDNPNFTDLHLVSDVTIVCGDFELPAREGGDVFRLPQNTDPREIIDCLCRLQAFKRLLAARDMCETLCLFGALLKERTLELVEQIDRFQNRPSFFPGWVFDGFKAGGEEKIERCIEHLEARSKELNKFIENVLAGLEAFDETGGRIVRDLRAQFYKGDVPESLEYLDMLVEDFRPSDAPEEQ